VGPVHFDRLAIRTDAPMRALDRIVLELSKR
jgi:hypothetical protein